MNFYLQTQRTCVPEAITQSEMLRLFKNPRKVMVQVYYDFLHFPSIPRSDSIGIP